MTVKKLLGLESFPLSDAEIMRKIKEAQNKKQDEIEFSAEGKMSVKVRLRHLSPDGLMKGNFEYYGVKGY